jgi:hypothetical protein
MTEIDMYSNRKARTPAVLVMQEEEKKEITVI